MARLTKRQQESLAALARAMAGAADVLAPAKSKNRYRSMFSDPQGNHRHTCPCGNSWKHSDKLSMTASEAEFRVAHTCTKCGEMVTEKSRVK